MDTFDTDTDSFKQMNKDMDQLRQNITIVLYTVIISAAFVFIVSLVVIHFVSNTYEQTNNLLQYHKMPEEKKDVV